MKKLKIGILGFGNMGSGHAENIMTGKTHKIELTAICDISDERRKAAREKYPDIAVFNSAKDMYGSGLLEAVIIAVPHYDHPKYVMLALKNNLHVMCEKPAGVYTKQVLEMNEAAKKSDKKFALMFNQRTNPNFKKIKEMIKSGQLGHIKKAIWIVTDWYRADAYHRSGTWRGTWKGEGGGTIMNQNPHNLDLWQWLFGMPDKVTAFCYYGKYHDLECDDDVTAYFEYENGMTGIYTTSTAEAPGTNRLEISCDMGKIVLENDKLEFYRNEISEREFNKTATGFGVPDCWKSILTKPLANPVSQHSVALDNFADAIFENAPLITNGCEGINEITLANSIYMSDWLGHKTIETKNFDHEKYYEMLNDKIENSTFKKTADVKTMDTKGTY